MAWYVVAAASVSPGSSGIASASVVQYADDAAFAKANGFQPGSPQDPIPNPKGGFPSQAAAQAAADKFNKQPASNRQTGTLPNPGADTVLPPNLNNPLSALSGIARALADIGGFFIHAWKIVSNWRMWASLGWLVLGAVLLLTGVSLYLYGEINPLKGLQALKGQAGEQF